jgi:hypothetical protein
MIAGSIPKMAGPAGPDTAGSVEPASDGDTNGHEHEVVNEAVMRGRRGGAVAA